MSLQLVPASDGETSDEDAEEACKAYHGLSPMSISPPRITIEQQDQQLQPGSTIPFLSALDNWEDYDISSRSADSLDDCLEDSDYKEYHFTGTNPVLLLSYSPGIDLHDGRLDEEGSEGDVESESDLEEDAARPERGFYDVSMLTGYEGAQVLVEDLTSVYEDAEASKSKDEEFLFLHPDVKLEYMISQSKKQLRIAKLLKLSEILKEKDKAAQSAKVVTSKGGNSLQAPELPPRAHTPTPKLMPDDYWIKDIPDSDVDGTEVDVCAKPNDEHEEVAEEILLPVPEVCSTQEEITVSQSPPKEKSSVPEHYEKEDIPWSPGQVKRTRHQLENRISSGLDHSPKAEGGRLRHSSQSSEGTSISQPRSHHSSLERLTDPIEDELEEGEKRRPTSLYEMEEIELEPGLVKRTRMQIEERERQVNALGGFGSLSMADLVILVMSFLQEFIHAGHDGRREVSAALLQFEA